MSRLALVAMFLSVASALDAQVRPPSRPNCDPRRMVHFVRESRPVEALAESEKCAAHFDRDTTMWRVVAGFYHYSNAQLQALLGAFPQAEAQRSMADRYPYGELTDMGSVSAGTEAFIYERLGDTAAAERAYRRANDGIAFGRLALLALQRRQDTDARNWARAGVAHKDATSLIVLGALEELAGERAIALGYYFAADERMDSVRNNFNPLYYLESWRAERALQGWGAANRGGGARIVVERGRRLFYDADGNIVGRDEWPGVLHLPEVAERQRAYNEWAARALAQALPGISITSQYPRNFGGTELLKRPNRSEDRYSAAVLEIRVPRHIEVTGVLDINTMAIGYYKLAVAWAQVCRDGGVPPAQLETPVEPSAMEGITSAARRATFRYQLGEALESLENLFAYLRGVRMRTAGGQVYDAAQESTAYDTFLAQLQRRDSSLDASRLAVEGVPSALLANPPDFITAHVPAEELSPELLVELERRERHARAGIMAARALLP